MKEKTTKPLKLSGMLQGDPFWDNLAKGQTLIRWTNAPAFSCAEVLVVNEIQSDRQSFYAGCLTVDESSIKPSIVTRCRADNKQYHVLPRKIYDELGWVKLEARSQVRELLLRVNQQPPLLPKGNTCFVLRNEHFASVCFGRVVFAITSHNTRFRPSKNEDIMEPYVIVELTEIFPFKNETNRSHMSVSDLREKSLCYISPRAYNKAKRISDNLNKAALQLLTPRYRPVCKDGLWGFEDVEMGIALPCLWAAVTPFCNGFASVMDSHGEWGLIDLNGDLSIPCEWAYLEYEGYFTAIARDHEGHEYHMYWNGDIFKCY